MAYLTQAQFEALYNTSGSGTFATNTSNAITSASLRAFAKDCSDNFYALDNPDLVFRQSNDFIFVNGTAIPDYTITASGAGAGAVLAGTFGVDNTEHALGVISLSTGTTAAGWASFVAPSLANIKFSYGHSLVYKFRVAAEVLSDGTNTYTLYLGFGDVMATAGAEPSNGAYFKYTHGTNSGKYQCVTANGGARTATDSGVAQTTLYKTFEIRVASDATSVVFLIDGAIVATNTTNIPSGVGVFAGWEIVKSLGATARLIDIDWYSFTLTRTVAR